MVSLPVVFQFLSRGDINCVGTCVQLRRCVGTCVQVHQACGHMCASPSSLWAHVCKSIKLVGTCVQLRRLLFYPSSHNIWVPTDPQATLYTLSSNNLSRHVSSKGITLARSVHRYWKGVWCHIDCVYILREQYWIKTWLQSLPEILNGMDQECSVVVSLSSSTGLLNISSMYPSRRSFMRWIWCFRQYLGDSNAWNTCRRVMHEIHAGE